MIHQIAETLCQIFFQRKNKILKSKKIFFEVKSKTKIFLKLNADEMMQNICLRLLQLSGFRSEHFTILFCFVQHFD